MRMTVPTNQRTIPSSHESESASARELYDEAGWDLPYDFESGLAELVLTGRAARHVCDNGRVLYEIQWSRPRPSTAAYRFH